MPCPDSLRSVTIRAATLHDVNDICALIIGLAEYEKLTHEVVWERHEIEQNLFGPNPSAHVDLAIHDATGEVAGFALWFPTFSTFLGKSGIWLEDLFVKPEFRGGGHGLALLQSLRARTEGRVEWYVLDWNESSIGFYKSLGAEPVDGWTRYRWLPQV
jgi:GNAT superfamily N-acetyltransferase